MRTFAPLLLCTCISAHLHVCIFRSLNKLLQAPALLAPLQQYVLHHCICTAAPPAPPAPLDLLHFLPLFTTCSLAVRCKFFFSAAAPPAPVHPYLPPVPLHSLCSTSAHLLLLCTCTFTFLESATHNGCIFSPPLRLWSTCPYAPPALLDLWSSGSLDLCTCAPVPLCTSAPLQLYTSQYPFIFALHLHLLHLCSSAPLFLCTSAPLHFCTSVPLHMLHLLHLLYLHFSCLHIYTSVNHLHLCTRCTCCTYCTCTSASLHLCTQH